MKAVSANFIMCMSTNTDPGAFVLPRRFSFAGVSVRSTTYAQVETLAQWSCLRTLRGGNGDARLPGIWGSAPRQPVGNCAADLVGAVLLQEVGAGNGDLGLVGPAAAVVERRAVQECTRVGVDQQLG
jgi:hypothetical protein